MIIRNSGKIIDGLYMVGTPLMPVYLLDGTKPAIFDAGLAFLGRMYTEAIRAILSDRSLCYCFLSHSHFDHCGAVAALKKSFPGLKAAASAGVKKVLERPNALTLIGQLTREAEQMARSMGIELSRFDPFEPFAIDLVLSDGQSLELSPDLTVQAIATPGHTRDCLSYYIPQKKVLLCSEAAGIPDLTGHIVSEALVDYDLYFSSMQRLSEIDFEVLCLGHRWALTGDEAAGYLDKSMAHCRRFLNLVETLLDEESGDVKKAVARIKVIEYDPLKEPKQIEAAYLLNLEAKVKAIKKRMEYDTKTRS